MKFFGLSKIQLRRLITTNNSLINIKFLLSFSFRNIILMSYRNMTRRFRVSAKNQLNCFILSEEKLSTFFLHELYVLSHGPCATTLVDTSWLQIVKRSKKYWLRDVIHDHLSNTWFSRHANFCSIWHHAKFAVFSKRNLTLLKTYLFSVKDFLPNNATQYYCTI